MVSMFVNKPDKDHKNIYMFGTGSKNNHCFCSPYLKMQKCATVSIRVATLPVQISGIQSL